MRGIIKSFSDHGTFIQPDAMDYIFQQENPHEFASMLLKQLKEYPLILTLTHVKSIEQQTSNQPTDLTSQEQQEKQQQTEMLKQLYHPTPLQKEVMDTGDEEEPDEELPLEESQTISEKPIKISSEPVTIGSGWKPPAKEYSPEVTILKDVTGESTCEGTTQDFTKLFQNRCSTLRKILQSQRRELANVIPINRINKTVMTEVQLVGIVKNIRTTSNGHRLIELEDETGTALLMALKHEREVHHLANEVVLDEIVGINGKISKNGDLIILTSIVFPDISLQHDTHKADVPVCAAFLSDIHIGSDKFLEKEWTTFLKWINGNLGNSRQKKVAGDIKYIVIPGDVVDGIGIYPNQEKELAITDIYQQYEMLAQQLQYLPDHVTILMQPGNHDAVRPAEPQPTFEKEIRDLFSGKDIRFIGNPCSFSLHGVEVLSYHGQSLLDFATNIQYLKYNEPIEIMKIMLKKRHLTPTYGGYTPLAPEHVDYMIIDKVPDIFVTGHVHMAAVDNYRGVTLINASSWQAQTSYQKMLNFVPDCAKVPITNLKTGNTTTMDFSRQLTS